MKSALILLTSFLALSLSNVPLQAQTTSMSASTGNLNPPPKACCKCITMSVNGKIDTDGHVVQGKLFSNPDGSYAATVVVGYLVPAPPNVVCENPLAFTIKATLMRDNLPVETKEQSQTLSSSNTSATLQFLLSSDTAKAGDTWEFELECGGPGNSPEADDTSAKSELGATDACSRIVLTLSSCSACEVACPASASQNTFSVEIPTSSSYGGMTTGQLVFYTKDFTNPGRANLLTNLPSVYTVNRTAGLLTSVNTGNSVLEIAPADALILAEDPDAFTVTEKNLAGTVIRTTTIAKVTVAQIPRLRMDSTYDGATIRHEQTQPSPGTLILEKGRVVANAFQSLSRHELVKTEITPGLRIHRSKLFDRATHTASWNLVADTESTWEKQSTSWVQTKEVINPSGTALTTGVPLTTTWSYYQPGEITGPGGSTHGLGRVKQMVRYDGYVSFHTYSVFESTITTPYAGNPAAQVVTSTWDPGTQTGTEVTAINGIIVAKSTSAYTPTTETNTTYTSATDTLTTVTHYVPSGQDFGGKPIRIHHPDGTLTTYAYTRLGGGGYTTVMENGAASGNVVSKGTRTTSTTNSRGTTILSKTEAIGYGTGSALFSSMAVTEVDILGRALTTAHHPTNLVAAGEQATASGAAYTTTTEYSCCGVAKEIDMYGIPTYHAYDHLQRQIKTNRLGVTMETVRLGLTTETHRYPETVTASLSSTLAGTSSTLIGRSVENLSGTESQSWSPDPTPDTRTNPLTDPPRPLIKSSTTATTYKPAAGLSTRTITTTVDNFSQTTDSYLDGSTFQTYGDLSPAMEYRYSVNTTGHFNAQAYLDGTTHREVTATQSDWAGRTIASASLPALNSLLTAHLALTTNDYNSLGQMVKSTDPDAVVTLMAYNALGEQIITAIDLDRDGTIDFGSDIVSGSERNFLASYAYDGTTSLPAIHSISKVWQPDAVENTPTITSNSYSAPNGLHAASTQLGVANPSLQKTTLSGNGNWITTSTAPDGTQQKQTYTAGLLTASSTLDASSFILHNSSISYDSLNRPEGTTDARTGLTETKYLSDTADIVEKITAPGNRETKFTYDLRGRQKEVDAPNSLDANGNTLTNITNTLYFPDGNVQETNGAQTYRVSYTYDYADRKSTMTTYGTVPATTTWLYDGQRGWLTEKNYHGEIDNPATTPADADYTYTNAGRLRTRTWERGTTTTYFYDFAGRLETTDYSDTTPDVTMEYDCLNRPKNQTNTIATTVFDYDDTALVLDKETITYNIPNQPAFTRVIDRSQDSLQRSTGFQLKNGSAPEQTVTYRYNENNGRLGAVSSQTIGSADTQDFIYGYEPNSNLLKTTQSFTNYNFSSNSGTGIHQVTNTFETNRDVLLTKANTRASNNTVISAVNYTVNNIGQRTNATRSGAATNSTTWGYDSLGQVTSADDSNNPADRAYQYDGIGNRIFSEISNPQISDPAGTNTTAYTPNALNQYDAVNTFVPSYDLDGNQEDAQIKGSAGLQPATFHWDGENRKTAVKDSNGNTLVSYHYDSQSRRIAQTTATNTTLYVLDGWNCIAEYQLHHSSFILNTSLLWGLDLSGTMQDAGGVGGLLSTTDHSSLITSHFPIYDGNGNITEYIDANVTVVAHYEYDPFGNTTVATGTKANDFSYRFSTKPRDTISGLYYYGYRWYDPYTGRWPSRDPIDEEGGYNLYGFISNNTNYIDYLGLRIRDWRIWPWNWWGRGKGGGGKGGGGKGGGGKGGGGKGGGGKGNESNTPFLKSVNSGTKLEVTFINTKKTKEMSLKEISEFLKSKECCPISFKASGKVMVDVDGSGGSHNDPHKQWETSYKPNGKSLNADITAFVVAPRLLSWDAGKGLSILRGGDRATATANGKTAESIVGDFGPNSIAGRFNTIFGELSYKLVQDLNIEIKPTKNGPIVDYHPVTINYFPKCKNNK